MLDQAYGNGELYCNVIQTAPVTSQATGVLAAIVFAGVVLLLQSRPAFRGSDPYWRRAFIFLLYVFFLFMIATFLYTIIGGERDSSCRQAFLEDAFATMVLVTGAAAMLLALCWLTAAYLTDQPEWPVSWVKVFAVALTLTVWTYLVESVLDALKAIGLGKISGGDWAVLLGLGYLVYLGIYFIILLWRRQYRSWFSRKAAGLFTLTLYISVFVAAVALAGYAAVTALDWQPEDFHPWWPYAVMGPVATIVGFYLANVAIIESVAGNDDPSR
jgi:hypothetical protein